MSHVSAGQNHSSETVCARFYDLRLRRHADFQAVYKVARKQYAKEMSFFFALRKADAADSNAFTVRAVACGPRVGLTVGKVLGKAHERNRIKRRLRAAVQRHVALLEAFPVDVVLHPRRTVLDLDWAVVEAEVAQAFRTVRKLADKPQLPSPPRDRSSARKPSSKSGKAAAAGLAARPGQVSKHLTASPDQQNRPRS